MMRPLRSGQSFDASALPTAPLNGETESSRGACAPGNLAPAETPDSEIGQLRLALDRLRRFVPPSLAKLILGGRDDVLGSHRCDVTVLFLDLRGFTAFAERAAPEDVMAVLREYHRAVGQLVSRYGGTLERFTGDGMMIFFNDPVPVPDPHQRAVALALAVHDRVLALMRGWGGRAGELGLGAGISHGSATIGLIGFEERCDYAAIGPVTNLAARLCSRARAGETLVCSRVMSAVAEIVDAEPLGPIQLGGFRDPVAAFRVLRPKAASCPEAASDLVASGAALTRGR